ncbi:MAG: type II toxin-antitoxin system VapC family toxin [Hyphomonadaceae bacterium]
MIVLDSSVIVALAHGEPEAARFSSLISDDGAANVSAANYLEASNVLEGRHGAPGRMMFEAVIGQLQRAGLATVAFDRQQAELAREGFRRYGKGRHPAGLNLGDCFAYALAKALDAPLLFKGGDFAKTDVACA